MTELLYFARWWIILSAIGLITLPLSFRLFRFLPDRGYGLSRPLGLLLSGYIFWLLSSFGYLRNTTGGALLAIVAMAVIAAWVYSSGRQRSLAREVVARPAAALLEMQPVPVLEAEAEAVAVGGPGPRPRRERRMSGGNAGDGAANGDDGHAVADPARRRAAPGTAAEPQSLPDWLRVNWRVVLTTELLFFVAFVLWALVRARNPEITSAGGEKWMELSFLNAISRSPNFPPLDPWLSGYAISYYYFGYVIMNLVVRLTNVPMSIAFNLGVASLFALTAVAAYSVTVNLVHGLWDRRSANAGDAADGDKRVTASDKRSAVSDPPIPWSALLLALLGPLFVLVLSNFEGVLEILYASGIGPAGFWKWLDIKDLNGTSVPNLNRFYMWWRASRVILDYNLAGQSNEVIQEFPFFSFLLGDMHPHVLALPFVTTAIGLAYNLLRKVRLAGPVASEPVARSTADGQWSWLYRIGQGIGTLIYDRVGLPTFVLLAVFLGGLGFLNTWDFPSYLLVTVAAYGLARYLWGGQRDAGLLWEVLGLAVLLGLGGVLFYIPFYIGFQSQAGGLVPNIINPTRFAQWFIMFGPFAILLSVFLARLVYERRRQDLGWRFSLALVLGAVGVVLLALVLAGVVASLTAGGRSVLAEIQQQSGGLGNLLQAGLARRLSSPGVTIFLVAVIVTVIALLYVRHSSEPARESGNSKRGATGDKRLAITSTLSEPVVFSLLLIGLGALLVLGPDYVFLLDLFRHRINTVFKFYYQGWMLFALACAFGSVYLLHTLRGAGQAAFIALLGLVVAGGLAYPAIALPEKMHEYGGPVTLDGKAAYIQANPDDYAAQLWLINNVSGSPVILEAVGDSYQDTARVSSITGLPTVLGWPFHEDQWRGTYDPQGSRRDDIQQIYTSRNWSQIVPLLDKYHVQYVYVGDLERRTYPNLQDGKFKQNMVKVFEQGGVAIYKR